MEKSPHAFRTISEVAAWLETPAHVLRFWESRFPEIAPVKRAGGRRYYRPDDMRLLAGIKHLLHTEGHTIKSVQDRLKADGPDAVSAFSTADLPGAEGEDTDLPPEDDAAEAALNRAEPVHDSEIPPIGFFFDDSADAAPAEAQSGTFAQTAFPPTEPELELESEHEPDATPAPEPDPEPPALAETAVPDTDADIDPSPATAPLPLPDLPPDPGDDAAAPTPLPVAAALRALDPETLSSGQRATLATLRRRVAALAARGDETQGV